MRAATQLTIATGGRGARGGRAVTTALAPPQPPLAQPVGSNIPHTFLTATALLPILARWCNAQRCFEVP